MFQNMFQVSVIIHIKICVSNFFSNYVKISYFKMSRLRDRFYNINHYMGRWIGGWTAFIKDLRYYPCLHVSGSKIQFWVQYEFLFREPLTSFGDNFEAEMACLLPYLFRRSCHSSSPKASLRSIATNRVPRKYRRGR